MSINMNKPKNAVRIVVFPPSKLNKVFVICDFKKIMHKIDEYKPVNIIWFNIYLFIIGSFLFFGFSFMYSSKGGSKANATPAKVSITIFIHSICITVTGVSTPIKGPISDNTIAHIFIVSCSIINFLILLNIVLPYNIALDIDLKLSSNIIISLASFATSVPLPIANPTSAFFNDGASFTPSPVIPTTKSKSWESLTSLLLSCGNARAKIWRFGIISFKFSSDILFISSLVKTIPSSFKIPVSFPIEIAVFLLSPVIITVLIPADWTNFIPSIVSFLISSFININPKNVKFLKCFSFTKLSSIANAITLIPLLVNCSILCITSSFVTKFLLSPKLV